MSVLKCLIIEDEPIAVEILTDYIEKVPYLELTASFGNAVEAISLLKSPQLIDVLFLDLHLPGIKGFDFLRSLNRPPQVIVVSAYHEYALEGYELNILDYLMKPVTFSRFLKAVQKLNFSQSLQVKERKEMEHAVFLSENRKKVRVIPSEIIFFESQKDYITLHMLNETVRTKGTIQSILEKLPNDDFLRIHRSFVVAISKIRAFSNTSIDLPNQSLPIGRNYKAYVQEVLNKQLKIS